MPEQKDTVPAKKAAVKAPAEDVEPRKKGTQNLEVQEKDKSKGTPAAASEEKAKDAADLPEVKVVDAKGKGNEKDATQKPKKDVPAKKEQAPPEKGVVGAK